MVVVFQKRFVIRFFNNVFHDFFVFNDTATTEIYTLSLHDALPIFFAHTGHAAHLRERPVIQT